MNCWGVWSGAIIYKEKSSDLFRKCFLSSYYMHTSLVKNVQYTEVYKMIPTLNVLII